jgi:adenine-specific DNA-methyltransferase
VRSRDLASSHDRARKARGAFFTPPEIARFIAEWAIRTPEDHILEPSAGEAEFLLAAGDRLASMGAGLFVGRHLHGVELHERSARAATARLVAAGYDAAVATSDFFDVTPGMAYDAVIGNPPYVRYQDFAGEARSKALEAALLQGVRLSGLASSWASFVVHASSYLTPKGRLGLVLPAELLTVKYASEVRRFLLNRFASVRLVMFEELVFPGVQEEVVLLLAEGTGPAPHFEIYHAQDLAGLPALDRARWMPFVPELEDKWLRALVSSDALAVLQTQTNSGAFGRLVDWGATYLGSVTGNNRYFTLTRQEAYELQLTENELVRISPPGSRHLRGLTFTTRAWEQLAAEGRRCYLFAPEAERISATANQYVLAGEKTGVHKAYKCRVRRPWWKVPLVRPGDLFLTYMDRERPRLVTNRAGVQQLNSLYGVRLHASVRQLGMDLLPLAALNSLTQLGAELVGRAYGGGMLKLEPREADKLPVPSPELLGSVGMELKALRPHLASLLRRSRLDEATVEVDRVILTAGMGLTFSEVTAIREARAALLGRRVARGSGADAKR